MEEISMGKLSITGKAEREVSYNAVEMSVTFYIHAKTTAEALQIVMEQSEKFLELVTAAGVDMKDILKSQTIQAKTDKNINMDGNPIVQINS